MSKPFPFKYKSTRARVFKKKKKVSRNGVFDMACCNWFIWSFPEVHAEHAVYSSNSSWQSDLHLVHFLLSTAFSSAIWIITEFSYGFSRKSITFIERISQREAHYSISMSDEDKLCLSQHKMYFLQHKHFIKQINTKNFTHKTIPQKYFVLNNSSVFSILTCREVQSKAQNNI